MNCVIADPPLTEILHDISAMAWFIYSLMAN